MTGHAILPSLQENNVSVSVTFCPREHCDLTFLHELQAGQQSIDCALYDLSDPMIVSSLNNFSGTLRVVVDDAATKLPFPVKKDTVDGLMHNKFCIIDHATVLTGSTNPTFEGIYRNNNNLLVIHSRSIAALYTEEFEELWHGTFRGGKTDLHNVVSYDSKSMAVYFCPEDDCEEHVLAAIEGAQQSVYFMTFSFTDDRIAKLLLNKRTEGITVFGIFEKSQLSNWSEYPRLASVSILDKNPSLMHHKVFIIDNSTVITGSYNPTSNGNTYNDENLMILHDPDLAARFLDEFAVVRAFDPLPSFTPKPAGTLLLSEVLYDSLGKDEDEEYIVLRNGGSTAMQLRNYEVSNGKTVYRFSSGSIEPEQELLVKRSTFRFALPNKEGMVLLHDPYGEQLDVVAWEGRWKLTAASGQIVKRVKFTDRNDEASWEVATP